MAKHDGPCNWGPWRVKSRVWNTDRTAAVVTYQRVCDRWCGKSETESKVETR